jgi:broad specificity phosphatase PhoE
MTHLYLVRHGQTDWNLEGRWQGHADVPLNMQGRQQAVQIASALADTGLAAIYSSDLQRALDTAQVIAAATGLQVRIDPRLREINQGEWQGMLATDIEARYGELLRQRKVNPLSVAPPGGESVQQVRDRVVAAIEAIRQHHPHQRVAVVSHGFALAMVQMHYLNYPLSQVWSLIPPNDRWVELQLNTLEKDQG